ncbi:S41 family peptidase [Shewanella colwelliana]|uniref:S41 family peptidase n=1 Tax=Shewanella colwelliana TaxID=23 RepID=UPI003734E691
MKFGHQTIINGFGLIMLISCIQLTIIAIKSEPPKQQLSYSEVRHELQTLRQHVTQFSAVAAQNPAQFDAFSRQLELIDTQHRNGMSTKILASQIAKALAYLDDASATISPISSRFTLPINLRAIDSDWLALDEQGNPIDTDAAFLTHIDGLPISRWVTASQQFLPPSLRERTSLQIQWLKRLSVLRAEIGIEDKPQVRLTLSDKGELTTQVILSLTPETPMILQARREQDNFENSPLGIINVNNLNAFEPNSPLANNLRRAILSPITILDLRYGYGDSDNLLSFLNHYYGYQYQAYQPYGHQTDLLSPDWQTSSIYAVARYKRHANIRADYLQSMHYTPYDQLSNQAQLELQQATNLVTNRDDKLFSQWHGKRLAIAPAPAMILPQPTPGKLVLIIGPQCKHACQWIAHFAKGWPNTVLIGEATLGNVDKHQRIKLPVSGINVRVTSTQVFDAMGQQLSGVGTQPDIEQPLEETVYWKGIAELIQM